MLFKTELVSRLSKSEINNIHNVKAYRRIKAFMWSCVEDREKKLEGVSVTMNLKSICGIIAGWDFLSSCMNVSDRLELLVD